MEEIMKIKHNMELLVELFMNYPRAEKFISGMQILNAQDRLIRICRLVGLPSIFSYNGVEHLSNDFRTILQRELELIYDHYKLDGKLIGFDNFLNFVEFSK